MRNFRTEQNQRRSSCPLLAFGCSHTLFAARLLEVDKRCRKRRIGKFFDGGLHVLNPCLQTGFLRGFQGQVVLLFCFRPIVLGGITQSEVQPDISKGGIFSSALRLLLMASSI